MVAQACLSEAGFPDHKRADDDGQHGRTEFPLRRHDCLQVFFIRDRHYATEQFVVVIALRGFAHSIIPRNIRT
jgi:hypothetical protein